MYGLIGHIKHLMTSYVNHQYIIYGDKRRSLIDVNKKDKKWKKNILIDIHTVTVAYLEQKFKLMYQVIVNQSIWGK